MQKLKIVERKIDELKPADYNPRKIGTREKMELTKSLKKFGFAEPLVININPKRKNVVIGGHQRLKVAKEIGFKVVPCVEMNLGIEEEKELNLRLNKNNGEFDLEALAKLSEDLLREVGFPDKELQKIFAGKEENEKEEEFSSEVLEENNYLVFVFDNSVDWLSVSAFFGLKTVQAKDSKVDYKRKGIGRVIDGKKLSELLDKK